MRTKTRLQAGAKRQKGRALTRPLSLPSLAQGDTGVLFKQGFRLDLVYLKLMRRALRRIIRRYRYLSHSRHVWVNLKPGYPISKKGKNARMGKGHGAFFRWAIRVPPHTLLLSLRGLSVYGGQRLIRRLGFFFTIPPHLLTSQSATADINGRGERWAAYPTYGAAY